MSLRTRGHLRFGVCSSLCVNPVGFCVARFARRISATRLFIGRLRHQRELDIAPILQASPSLSNAEFGLVDDQDPENRRGHGLA